MPEVTLELMNDDGTVWKTIEHVPFTEPEVRPLGHIGWVSKCVNAAPICFSVNESRKAPRIMRARIGDLILAVADDVTWEGDMDGGPVSWLNAGNIATLRAGQVELELKV